MDSTRGVCQSSYSKAKQDHSHRVSRNHCSQERDTINSDGTSFKKITRAENTTPERGYPEERVGKKKNQQLVVKNKFNSGHQQKFTTMNLSSRESNVIRGNSNVSHLLNKPKNVFPKLDSSQANEAIQISGTEHH